MRDWSATITKKFDSLFVSHSAHLSVAPVLSSKGIIPQYGSNIDLDALLDWIQGMGATVESFNVLLISALYVLFHPI